MTSPKSTLSYRIGAFVSVAVIFVACGTAAGPARSITPTGGTGSVADAAIEASADPSAATVALAPEVDVATPLPQGSKPVTLDPADFTTEIDNPYWPLTPGTRWTFREVAEDGQVTTIVIIATHETKQIANGITARVVRDTVSEDGAVVEDTFDWYAQDQSGNVWYLGEDTATVEDGEIVSKEGSFEAGVDGALPGIAMPGDPQSGVRFRQEFYQGKAEDHAEILSTSEMTDVPAGHFEDVVLTKDTMALEPDILEYKLYAPGIGPVLFLGISGGSSREELIRVDRVPNDAGIGPLGSPDS